MYGKTRAAVDAMYEGEGRKSAGMKALIEQIALEDGRRKKTKWMADRGMVPYEGPVGEMTGGIGIGISMDPAGSKLTGKDGATWDLAWDDAMGGFRVSPSSPTKLTVGSLTDGPVDPPPGPVHYGTRVAPKGTQFAIQSLQDNPTALMVLLTMITCIGHGCVIKATRQKVMEITGLSASSYTRAINTLMAHGFLWPNMPTTNTYVAGYISTDEMPKNRNGARYKIGPFISFRGPKEFKEAEMNRYNTYMRQRLAKRLTPSYDLADDNITFLEIPSEPTATTDDRA